MRIEPAVRPIERAHQVEERRLARARRPDDRDELALVDGEAHAAQRLDGGLARIDLRHRVDLEHRRGPFADRYRHESLR